jgi:predicted nucleotidyltransferase
MKYGLSAETLDRLNAIFRQFSAIQKVIIYGSRAKGNFKKGSDIDLVILGPELALKDLNAIRNKIDDLLLPWKFDLCLFHHIQNPDLIDHINRVGQEIYR